MRIYSFGALDGFPNALEAPAFLIEDKGTRILVDVPANIQLYLHEIGLSVMDLDAIVITHLHNDHIGGLVDLIQLRTICLNNEDLMRDAGYFTTISTRVLPIHVGGYIANQDYWRDVICKQLDFNCPKKGEHWSKYVERLSAGLGGGSFLIENTEVCWRETTHSTACIGVKVGGVAISGDGPCAGDHLVWLMQGTSLVFHEAGYAGSHTKFADLPEIMKRCPSVQFYHLPFPAKEFALACGYPIAEKRWYDVP